MQVQIVIFEGFEELDAIAPFSVLENAARAGAEIRAELVTLDETAEVVASHGLRVRPGGRLLPERRPDILIVPGGNWNSRAPQGTRSEVARGAIPRVIEDWHQHGVLIAGVCTGAMLIAASGILVGRPATTHHAAIEDLRGAGPQIIDARVVDDGDLITAGGVTSGLDLALWLVERCIGAPTAQRVETMIEYERRGTVWRRTPPGSEMGGGR